jgi:hypothetical protein
MPLDQMRQQPGRQNGIPNPGRGDEKYPHMRHEQRRERMLLTKARDGIKKETSS